MKKLLLLPVVLMSLLTQAQNFGWVKTPYYQLDLNPDMVAYCTALDPSGNIYFAGFKDNPFPYNDILGDQYYEKYSSSGDMLFSKTITGKAIVNNITADTEGNIIMALGFYETVTFDGITLEGTDQNMLFALIKFDSNGNHLWHKELMIEQDGFFWISDFRAITTDTDNNIYAGYDNFSLSYIKKFSPAGTELLTIAQDNVGRITSLGVDNAGNIYAAGSCASQYDATFAGIEVPSGLIYNTYLVKYSAAGEYRWVKFVEDVTCSESRVAVKSPDAVYFSSSLFGSFAFDSITAEGPLSSEDFFLAKLNAEGQCQWVREVHGQGNAVHGRRDFLSLDNSGNIYLSGRTSGEISWGNNIQTSTTGIGTKSLLLRYNPQGTVVNAVTFAGSGYSRADGVSISTSGDIYLAGMGYGSGTFGDITYTDADNDYYIYLTKINFAALSAAGFSNRTALLYPNPAGNYISLEGIDNGLPCSVINLLGQPVMSFISASHTAIDITRLPSGTYFVKAEGYKILKFIKN